MDWIQVFSICAYLTVVCAFFYYFNEKTIREWRGEHKAQMKEWRSEHEKQMEKIREDRKENDKHWREMFMHFNSRLDSAKKG